MVEEVTGSNSDVEMARRDVLVVASQQMAGRTTPYKPVREAEDVPVIQCECERGINLVARGRDSSAIRGARHGFRRGASVHVGSHKSNDGESGFESVEARQ